ncbi:polysaccharide biosynthesis C-terminal domain-containing protein [Pseudonocardia sp. DLS-67]
MQDDGTSSMLVFDLDNTTDARGLSYSVLWEQLKCIGSIADMHIAEIEPGSIRGNHYHAKRGEIIAVVFRDRWSLHWDEGEGTDRHVRNFDGVGAVAVIPPRGWSHAVKNDGKENVLIVASSDQPYDRHATDEIEKDAIRRVVAE